MKNTLIYLLKFLYLNLVHQKSFKHTICHLFYRLLKTAFDRNLLKFFANRNKFLRIFYFCIFPIYAGYWNIMDLLIFAKFTFIGFLLIFESISIYFNNKLCSKLYSTKHSCLSSRL